MLSSGPRDFYIFVERIGGLCADTVKDPCALTLPNTGRSISDEISKPEGNEKCVEAGDFFRKAQLLSSSLQQNLLL